MKIETSPLLEEISWLKHGFYGRDAAVENTLAGMVEKTAYASAPILFLPQKHTDVVIEAGCDIPETGADASITDKPGVALALKTADCVPLLLVCTKTKIVAAVHAGWQGALNRIAAKTVQKMVEKGAKPSRIVAALGPSIHQESFQVQEDVRDKFRAEQPETIGFFKTFGDRWLLDVGGVIAHQLEKEGVTKIGFSPTNTFTSPNHYSFRRRHDDPANETGRNVSFILINSAN